MEEKNQLKPSDTKKPKNIKKILIALIIISILVAGLFISLNEFVLQSTTNDDDNQAASNEEIENTKDDEKLATATVSETKNYTNIDCKVSFDYPKSWGEISLKDFAGGPEVSGDFKTGSFSTNANVSFGLISHTWKETHGRGGSLYDAAGWKRFGADFYSISHDYATGELKINGPIEGATSNSVIQGVNARAVKSKFPVSEFFGDKDYIQTRYNLDGPSCYAAIFVLTDISKANESDYDDWIKSVKLN